MIRLQETASATAMPIIKIAGRPRAMFGNLCLRCISTNSCLSDWRETKIARGIKRAVAAELIVCARADTSRRSSLSTPIAPSIETHIETSASPYFGKSTN